MGVFSAPHNALFLIDLKYAFGKHIDALMLISFPVAQMVEHGASNAKIMGSIPRESKSW